MSKETPKIVFMPGCFDSFDGTQEELDEMIAEITRMAESGELLENSRTVSLDDIEDQEIVSQLNALPITRNLQ